MYEITSVTPKFPSVRVPVLSKTIASMFRTFSNPVLSLISTPLFAVIEVDKATTRGIARPKAWGQAITNTVTALSKAKSGKPIRNHAYRRCRRSSKMGSKGITNG